MRVLWVTLFATATPFFGGCGGGELPTENDLPVRCLDQPDPGPCKAHVLRYFYDYRYDRCRPFHYGGCEGHVPFATLDACEETCVGSGM